MELLLTITGVCGLGDAAVGGNWGFEMGWDMDVALHRFSIWDFTLSAFSLWLAWSRHHWISI